MVALAFFLLGSQPGQGGIQVREVQYYFKQASKFYALTTTPIARFHDSLSLILLLLSMGCQELARKAQLISLHDQIALLASYTSIYDVISAVFLTWAGLLQLQNRQKRASFSLVLAYLRYHKLRLPAYAAWNLLTAWTAMKTAEWPHIQYYFKTKLLALLADETPFDEELFRRVESMAYGSNSMAYGSNSIETTPQNVPIPDFFKPIETIPAEIAPFDVQIAVPLILSTCVRYQENRGEDDPAKWPHLSDNREEDDRFAAILSRIVRSHVTASKIPQFHEGDGYNRKGEKGETVVSIGQKIAVEIEVQNPLNEVLKCPKIELVVRGNVETQSDSMELGPLERKVLRLIVIPRESGEIDIEEIRFEVETGSQKHKITAKQTLSLRGIRLNKTLEQRQHNIRGKDTALHMHVVPQDCAMSIQLGEFHDFHYFSELSKIPIILTNRGDCPVSEVILLTTNYHWFPHQMNRTVCDALFALGTSSEADPIQCYSLLKEGETLPAGVSLEIGSFIHFPESEENEFVREGMYELKGVFLFVTCEGQWRMIRFHRNIPMKRLIHCKEQKIAVNEGVSFYKTIVENVSDEQKIERISVGEGVSLDG